MFQSLSYDHSVCVYTERHLMEVHWNETWDQQWPGWRESGCLCSPPDEKSQELNVLLWGWLAEILISKFLTSSAAPTPTSMCTHCCITRAVTVCYQTITASHHEAILVSSLWYIAKYDKLSHRQGEYPTFRLTPVHIMLDSWGRRLWDSPYKILVRLPVWWRHICNPGRSVDF
jgi:hypothetical protein